jgi:NADH-quinone oxidoreductase subunit E
VPSIVKLYDLETGEVLERFAVDAHEAVANDPKRYALKKPQPKAAPAEAPAKKGDDLTQIKGIGKIIAAELNNRGVFTYGDLAALTPEKIAELEAALHAPGRVGREDWVGQAQKLAEDASAG